MHIEDIKLAVVGLGYVGLPLAVEFAKTRKVVGFDINKKRISNLKIGKDETLEVSNQELSKIKSLSFIDSTFISEFS
jgi:UDP-N-acetyl-D-galactosamine dehydrogenase